MIKYDHFAAVSHYKSICFVSFACYFWYIFTTIFCHFFFDI